MLKQMSRSCCNANITGIITVDFLCPLSKLARSPKWISSCSFRFRISTLLLLLLLLRMWQWCARECVLHCNKNEEKATKLDNPSFSPIIIFKCQLFFYVMGHSVLFCSVLLSAFLLAIHLNSFLITVWLMCSYRLWFFSLLEGEQKYYTLFVWEKGTSYVGRLSTFKSIYCNFHWTPI